ncbi:GAF domain-containing protein [Desulfoplanes sp.]
MMKPEASLENLTQIVGNIFEAYSVAVFLPKEDGYILKTWFSLGNDIAARTCITPGQGLVGWIIRNEQPLLVSNFDQKKSFLGYYNRGGEDKIKTFMGSPIPHIGGALCVDSKKTYSFVEKDQKILGQFSNLIAMTCKDGGERGFSKKESCLFECMQILPQLRERFPRWSSFLHRFLDLLSQSTDFPYCFLAVRDEWGKGYFLEGWNDPGFVVPERKKEKFKIGSGVVGWTFKHQQPVFSQEGSTASEGVALFGKDQGPLMKTVICLPLVVHKRTRGVLVLADNEGRPIEPALKRFAVTVADYLALFLENLYLKNRLQQKAGGGSSGRAVPVKSD